MLTSTEHHAATSPPPPRLLLQPGLPARTLLDGGWWPRSADPPRRLLRLLPRGHIDDRAVIASGNALDQDMIDRFIASRSSHW